MPLETAGAGVWDKVGNSKRDEKYEVQPRGGDILLIAATARPPKSNFDGLLVRDGETGVIAIPDVKDARAFYRGANKPQVQIYYRPLVE